MNQKQFHPLKYKKHTTLKISMLYLLERKHASTKKY